LQDLLNPADDSKQELFSDKTVKDTLKKSAYANSPKTGCPQSGSTAGLNGNATIRQAAETGNQQKKSIQLLP
jgi:hypothetical protein